MPKQPKTVPVKTQSRFQPRKETPPAVPAGTDFTTIKRTKAPHTGLNSGQK